MSEKYITIDYDINNYQLFSVLCQRYLEVGTYKINLKDENVSLIVKDTQIKNVKKVLNYLKKEYQNGVNISLLKIKIIYDMINQDENATLYNCKKKFADGTYYYAFWNNAYQRVKKYQEYLNNNMILTEDELLIYDYFKKIEEKIWERKNSKHLSSVAKLEQVLLYVSLYDIKYFKDIDFTFTNGKKAIFTIECMLTALENYKTKKISKEKMDLFYLMAKIEDVMRQNQRHEWIKNRQEKLDELLEVNIKELDDVYFKVSPTFRDGSSKESFWRNMAFKASDLKTKYMTDELIDLLYTMALIDEAKREKRKGSSKVLQKSA